MIGPGLLLAPMHLKDEGLSFRKMLLCATLLSPLVVGCAQIPPSQPVQPSAPISRSAEELLADPQALALVTVNPHRDLSFSARMARVGNNVMADYSTGFLSVVAQGVIGCYASATMTRVYAIDLADCLIRDMVGQQLDARIGGRVDPHQPYWRADVFRARQARYAELTGLAGNPTFKDHTATGARMVWDYLRRTKSSAARSYDDPSYTPYRRGTF